MKYKENLLQWRDHICIILHQEGAGAPQGAEAPAGGEERQVARLQRLGKNPSRHFMSTNHFNADLVSNKVNN